jgi:exosortase B
MSAIPADKGLDDWQAAARSIDWWPVGLGLAILYVPTYYGLATTIWGGEANSHGPIAFAVVLWALWKARDVLRQDGAGQRPILGSLVLAFGLLAYAVGRSQQITIMEVGSQIPVLVGTLLALKGPRALRRVWFPLVFILFLCPLPSFVVDSLTAPLKQHVSATVDSIMYALGYPIARAGVTLMIGPYQLLVADACSGLNSIVSLSAVALIYIHISGERSVWRNLVMLGCVIPIAFLANVTRVMALVLITYYLGDEAGQGFLHEFAGLVMFVVALSLLMLLHSLLRLAPQAAPNARPL